MIIFTIAKPEAKVNEPLPRAEKFATIFEKKGVLPVSEKKYIGVFDSGVGGVSVLRELMKRLPREDFYYFGDSANAPYGPRPTQEVRDLSIAASEHLLQLGAKCLVVACNTATAAAINALREKYPEEIIIGIEPALKLAADRHPGGTIGVMATEVTLREEKYAALVRRCQQYSTVIPLPSPGIVELVEADRTDSPEAYELLHKELDPYVGKLDALVLGCTHYPFAEKTIRDILGKDVDILHGGPGTARETQRRLAQAGLLKTEGEGSLTIENSSGEKRMIELTYKLLTRK